MRPLSDHTKANIRAQVTQGKSTRQIATSLGVGRSTVAEYIKKNCPEAPRNSGGRPKRLSDQDKRFAARQIPSGNAKTAVDVAKSLKEQLDKDVTPRTVRNALHDAGLAAIEKPTKPLISDKNVRARLDFAKAHADWTLDDWQHVIWSDETKINRFCSDGRQWAWVRDGESLKPGHVKQTVKHGGGNIMMWGCMTWHGVGYACKIDGKMDQELYKKILADELQNTIDFYELDASKAVFQHDNDPKHTTKSVNTWLAKQPYSVMEWPASSPDLNPIEHLWAHVKRQLAKHEVAPCGMLELWMRVKSEWNAIPAEVCRNLIESMPRRLEAIIKAKGRWTKY